MAGKNSNTLLFIILAAILLAGAVILYPGYRNLRKKRSDLQTAQQRLADKQQEVQRKQREVDKLENDPATIEAVARREHHMSIPGETVMKYR